MKKIKRITNIALIFTLGMVLCQDVAKAIDVNHLRVPVGQKSIYETIAGEMNEKEDQENSSFSILVPTEEVRKRFTPPKGKQLIGVKDSRSGRLKPLFSKSTMFGNPRFGDKPPHHFVDVKYQAKIIPLAIEKADNEHLRVSEDWSYLPPDIKEVFQKGNILVTKPYASRNSRYSVLINVEMLKEDQLGRGGLLLRDGLPIIVRINGREFALEIKGSGAVTGGFDGHIMWRGPLYEESIVKGGVRAHSAEREFRYLELKRKEGKKFNKGKAPRAVACMTFAGKDEAQGQILRLTPTTVRVSYIQNRHYPIVTTPHLSRKNSRLLGEGIAEMLSMDPVLHIFEGADPGNLLVLNNRKDQAFTDYADFRLLTEIKGNSKLSFRIGLNANRWIAGYRHKSNFPAFLRGLSRGLERNGKISKETGARLRKVRDEDELTDVIWDELLAYETYSARKILGKSPSITFSSESYQDTFSEDRLKKVIENAQHYDFMSIQHFIKESNISMKYGIPILSDRSSRREGLRSLRSIKTPKDLDMLPLSPAVRIMLWEDIGSMYADVKAYIENEKDLLITAEKAARRRTKRGISGELKKNITLVTERVDQFNKLSIYQFFQEVMKNGDFIKEMTHLPYYEKEEDRGIRPQFPPARRWDI